jgi:hypothetical protein
MTHNKDNSNTNEQRRTTNAKQSFRCDLEIINKAARIEMLVRSGGAQSMDGLQATLCGVSKLIWEK